MSHLQPSLSKCSALLALLLGVVLLASLFKSTAATAANTCDSEVVWIEVGPYFVDGQAEQSDVKTGQSGLSLNLTLLVLDGRNTTTDQCTPLSNVKIDIWECDWDGVYSDESSEDTLGELYLRGYQLTNASGYAQFETVYPGWYAGRTPHVHFRLRVYDGVNGALSYDETTQFFFNDSMTDYVYANIYPYTQHPGRDTYNNASNVYTVDNQLNLSGSVTGGFNTFVLLSIPLGGTTSTYILGNGTNSGGGGSSSSSSNTTSGGGGGGGGGSGSGGAPTGGAGGGSGGGGAPSGVSTGGSGGLAIGSSSSSVSVSSNSTTSLSSSSTQSTSLTTSTQSASTNASSSSSSSSTGVLKISTSAAPSLHTTRTEAAVYALMSATLVLMVHAL